MTTVFRPRVPAGVDATHVDATRRRFVQGLAAGGALCAAGLVPGRLAAAQAAAASPVLSGTDFDLVIGETPVDFTGRTRTAVTVNGSLPAPLLRFREGTQVTLRVRNALPKGSVHGSQTSIHWHGLLLPANMDGVPGLSFAGIDRGETYLYRFDVRQSGTYWYHAHSGYQEQSGLYGPIVIDPAGPDPIGAQRDHVVLLSDWTDLSPAALYARLKKFSGHDNFYRRTLFTLIDDLREAGAEATLADRGMWGRMRMTPTDLSDVNGHTYTYLVNGRTTQGNWTGLYERGERVRLRFINGSAMTHFDVRVPGLRLTVVAADGQPVHPVSVDEFRIAPAETYDVIVEPGGDDAYTIFAQDIGRTGFVAGTLAVREGLRAPVPPVDPRQILTMADMGHGSHGAGAHAGHGVVTADPHAAHGAAMAADPHAAHGAAMAADPHAAHSAAMTADPHAGHGAAAAADPHAGHGAAPAPDPHAGHGGAPAAIRAAVTHPDSEAGNPLVDMQAVTPEPRLDDPGVGLRGNGREVLTYSMLRSLFPDPDGREPGRDVELHLTGHMEKFAWGFDGRKFSQATPLRFQYGERLRIVLVNDTMMTHPIHLHGMWSDLEDEDGQFLVRKHTIDMPPGTRRSYRVRADALGHWAYHCHLLYHMEAGMMRQVTVHE
jgi:CopA family copper-resistance protein